MFSNTNFVVGLLDTKWNYVDVEHVWRSHCQFDSIAVCGRCELVDRFARHRLLEQRVATSAYRSCRIARHYGVLCCSINVDDNVCLSSSSSFNGMIESFLIVSMMMCILMQVWRVFAPKFIFDALTMFVIDLTAMLFIGIF